MEPVRDQRRPHADNDNVVEEYRSRSTIEELHAVGAFEAVERARHARRQRSPEIKHTREAKNALRDEHESAIASLTRIATQAGGGLAEELATSTSLHAAYGLDRTRKSIIKRRLGQRSGLLRLLQVEFHTDFPAIVTQRSALYVSHMLAITANVAVLSNTEWPAALRWFTERLPILTRLIAPDRLEAEFNEHLKQARAKLAGRVQLVGSDFLTGPSVAEIAADLQITIEQLRYAGANRCGLTSINPEDRKCRDRNRKERDRRAKGMRPQAERTATAALKALAGDLGCSLRTVQRHQAAGTLDAFRSARQAVSQECPSGI